MNRIDRKGRTSIDEFGGLPFLVNLKENLVYVELP
jgi:hypothetical protein